VTREQCGFAFAWVLGFGAGALVALVAVWIKGR
jgi:hypothetical protein